MLSAQTNFRIGLKHFLVTVSVFQRNVLLALKYIHCNKSVVCNTCRGTIIDTLQDEFLKTNTSTSTDIYKR